MHMNGAFYVGATGLDAQQRALDVVAHDIANLNTTAFKRSAIRFSELAGTPPSSEIDRASPQAAAQLAGGVALNAPSRIWSQGDLHATGNAMDIAIQGNGYIETLDASGQTALWRGGALKVGDDGYLATADGSRLRAMISVPQDASGLTIGRDGTVTAQLAGDTSTREIGRIDLVMAKNPDQLQDAGGGYYAADPADLYNMDTGQDGEGALVQGSLEQSNVQLSDEMVTLLLLQRSYAANAQLVQAGDQLMSIANNLRR